MKHDVAANLKKHEGFSLVELMVVLVIASIMSLAIFGIMTSTESQKRTMTATNDATQAGNYAMYQLDKIIRAAGSGYGSLWQTAYGCKLFATLSNSKGASGQILPFPTAKTMAAPFSSLNSTLKGKYVLAPLLIASQATTGTTDTSSGGAQAKPSDALIVMSGSAGYGEFPVIVTAATESSFSLKTYSGFNAGDLILEVNDTANGSASNCIMQQVASDFAWSAASDSLPLGGAYSGSPIGTADITANISAVSSVVDLGNATTGNLPSFQIIGVGPNNVLNSYDLLQGGTSGSTFNTPTALADSVFEMHA
ncbi:MAG TPA: prepilin-type N-terminal cleavage/methylation domain-containing protein, partial [Burkholderiaceae bacterium]